MARVMVVVRAQLRRVAACLWNAFRGDYDTFYFGVDHRQVLAITMIAVASLAILLTPKTVKLRRREERCRCMWFSKEAAEQRRVGYAKELPENSRAFLQKLMQARTGCC